MPVNFQMWPTLFTGAESAPTSSDQLPLRLWWRETKTPKRKKIKIITRSEFSNDAARSVYDQSLKHETIKTRYGAYWCHSHSTLLWHTHGYNIDAGNLAILLRDSYKHVTRKPLVGDIIVWENKETGVIEHTARVEKAVHGFGEKSEVTVSHKPGPALAMEPVVFPPDKAVKNADWVRRRGYYRKRSKHSTMWDKLPIASVIKLLPLELNPYSKIIEL